MNLKEKKTGICPLKIFLVFGFVFSVFLCYNWISLPMLGLGRSHSVFMRCSKWVTGRGQVSLRWTLCIWAAPSLASPGFQSWEETSWLCEVVQKIKRVEMQKRERLDLSKWVEEEVGTWAGWPGAFGRIGLEWKGEKCDGELEDDAETDLMKSLKILGRVRVIVGGVGQERGIPHPKKELHVQLDVGA